MTTPGWYDDRHGFMRWWDGAQWTEHVAGPAPAAPGVAPAQPGYPAAPYYGAPPARRKSKLWILWVALGVVFIAGVVGVAAIIPLVSDAISTAGAHADPANADEKAAVAAIEQYDRGWRLGVCDDYMSATTHDFRVNLELTNCHDFNESATSYNEEVKDYTIAVKTIRETEGQIEVTTVEKYTMLTDDDGNPLDEPTDATEDWTYTVVEQNGHWRIDSAESR